MERNRKDCTEEDLFNLSSDTVYLLFVSFCRFHKTFGFNQIVSMRDLLFFLVFNFFWIKENINSPRLGILSNFTFSVKCLDCAINLLIHTFSGGASVSWRLLPLVCVKWRVFLKQQLIPTMFKRPRNLKGVTSVMKGTELYPFKFESKSQTSSTFFFQSSVQLKC